MLFFRLVERRQVEGRKISVVFDSKRECFFLHFHKYYSEDFMICIEEFLPGNAGECDLSLNAF